MPPGQETTQLVEWEDVYTFGKILRDLSMTHIPEPDAGDPLRRPDNLTMQDMMDRGDAPDYTEELKIRLQGFEWVNMENGLDLNDLQNPRSATAADADWILNTLLPAAQARVAQYRAAPKPRGYWNDMDVSWTKPQTIMPFVYIDKYAGEAGDDDDAPEPSSYQDERQQSERLRMRTLREQHRWDEIRPYQVYSLEHEVTTPKAIHNQPPG